MNDRYSQMSKEQLVAEMEAWDAVAVAPKDRQGPSNAAREAANNQFALAEAWYYRAHDRREEISDKELIVRLSKRVEELEKAARKVVNQDAKPEYDGRYSELRAHIGKLRGVLGAEIVE